MPIYRSTVKILKYVQQCLSAFELYSHWVPLQGGHPKEVQL